MSEFKLISPLLDNFDMGDPISHHDGVRCCPAMEKDSDKKYIVKVVSIPASQVQLDALLLTGAYQSAEAAGEYFKDLSEGVEQEAQILQKLSSLEGFLPYETWQTVPMEQGTGYNVYLLGYYRRTLEQHFRRKPMTHLGAINLGLDLCAALAVCRHSGYLYINLKPGNVCIVDDNAYRIFDLGFVQLNALKYASLPDRYISQYTAPEITDAFSALNSTIDIYAAGLILYQAYNGGELPFKDGRAPAEVLPAPAYADYEMAEIILKACAPDPSDRWQDPIQMGQAIVGYMQRNGANDTPIIPLPGSEEEHSRSTSIHDSSVGEVTFPAAEDDAQTDAQRTEDEESAPDVQIEESAVEESQIIAAEPDPESTNVISTIPVGSEDTIDSDASFEDSAENSKDAFNPDESIYMEDDFGNLTFLVDATYDETLPDGDSEEIEYHEVSEEVSEILSYADELIAHPTPDPVIQPEPISVPVPEPLPAAEEHAPAEPDLEEQTEPDAVVDTAVSVEIELPETTPEVLTEDDTEEDSEETAPKTSWKRWLIGILSFLLALGVVLFGFYYYQHYYLQPVSLNIDGTEDSLVVYVSSDIDESKLTVLCADTYGNSLSSPVVDGKASFSNLTPGAGYTVSVKTSGFHRLTGDIATAYSTPVQTNVIQFIALTGPEDGSVILSFTIDGPDPQQWSVRYSADGEDNKSQAFSGHMVTLYGLSVGKEYTFTLESENTVYLSGEYQLSWTPGNIVYAEELKIDSCAENKLAASWTAPEGAAVEYWTVRCYNGSDYDETIKTESCNAVFENLDHTDGFTVEVTAAEMTVGQRTYISENSITITEYTVDYSDPAKLVLTWNSNQSLKNGNWVLLYSVDGSHTQEVYCSSENKAVIDPVIPGSDYTFTLMTSMGTDVFNGTYAYTTEDAKNFSNYNVTSDKMEFNMVRTPEEENWDRYDVPSSDYTTTFTIGEKASFLVRMRKEYNTSSDLIVTTFVIRDSSGTISSIAASEQTWTSMWYKNYCELDIPVMPDTEGTYSITIYFNGYFAGQQEFKITK